MSPAALGIALNIINKLGDLKDQLTEEEYEVLEEVTRDMADLTLQIAALPEGENKARAKLIIELGHVKATLLSYEALKKQNTYEKISLLMADVLKHAARAAILLL